MVFGDPDASTPAFVKTNTAGKAATSASFTPPAGAALVAWAWHDTAGGNLTNTSVVTSSDGAAGTGVTVGGWSIQATRSKQSDGAGAANGHLQVSTAVATGVAMTVTTTGVNTNNPAGLYCGVYPGVDATPMDATPVEGTTNGAVVSTSITTATDGARGYLGVIDWNVAAAMTAGAGQTALISDAIGASDDRIYLGVTNAVTSPAGATALSTGGPATGNTQNWIGIALRPAAGGATNLPAGNAAAAVAANPATLAASLPAGGAAAAVAANPVTLNACPAAGNAAVTAAANPATLNARPGVGNAAVTAAANAAGLTSGLAAGGAAVTVGALDASVTVTGATSLPVGNAIISVGAFDVRLTGGNVTTMVGSWQGLLDILNDIRQQTAEQLAMPPVACPRCGEPLETARGTLHCRFDGWTPDGVTL